MPAPIFGQRPWRLATSCWRCSGAELSRIALDDALRICLVLRDGDPERYQRQRCAGSGASALEARDVAIKELRVAAQAPDALRDRSAEAMERLRLGCEMSTSRSETRAADRR